MKKIFLVLLACLLTSLMFTSCEKNNISVDSIVGKWRITHSKMYWNGQLVTDEQVPEANALIYEFHKSGTGVQSYAAAPSYHNNFTWELEGTTLTMIYDQASSRPIIWNIKKMTSVLLSVESNEGSTDYVYDLKKIK